MRPLPRAVIAAASVGAIAAAVIASLALGPRETRAWLLVPGFVAVALSISSVVAEPRELLASIVLGAAPLMGLATEDAPSWMIGPLAVLLLIGGELNALSWELGGSESTGSDARRRLGSIMRLAAIGLGASLAVSVAARAALFDGLVAVAVAAAALAGMGWVILPGFRARRRSRVAGRGRREHGEGRIPHG